MDPITTTNGVLAAGGFAREACTALHGVIRGLKSRDRKARMLEAELGDLIEVLELFLETFASNPSLDFGALKLPLVHCGNACKEYMKVIDRFIRHSHNTSWPSVRDWLTQKYLQGDINDFKTMLAAHKATINIALAYTNL